MQIAEPNPEHLWLHQLVGEWTVESEFQMAPDQPPMKTTGHEVVRTLGKFWTLAEGFGGPTEKGSCDSIMTLGYDPHSRRFVGSFIAAAMSHFWPYNGSLDESGKVLTLDSVGPNFSGDGTMAKYQDIITVLTPDHRTLTALVQNADGTWRQFMTTHYRRKTSVAAS